MGLSPWFHLGLCGKLDLVLQGVLRKVQQVQGFLRNALQCNDLAKFLSFV
jgi:hypothetical protein